MLLSSFPSCGATVTVCSLPVYRYLPVMMFYSGAQAGRLGLVSSSERETYQQSSAGFIIVTTVPRSGPVESFISFAIGKGDR